MTSRASVVGWARSRITAGPPMTSHPADVGAVAEAQPAVRTTRAFTDPRVAVVQWRPRWTVAACRVT